MLRRAEHGLGEHGIGQRGPGDGPGDLAGDNGGSLAEAVAARGAAAQEPVGGGDGQAERGHQRVD